MPVRRLRRHREDRERNREDGERGQRDETVHEATVARPPRRRKVGTPSVWRLATHPVVCHYRAAVRTELFGRETEVAALETFLSRHHDGTAPAALVLEGEAGIGKSSLWLAGVERARGDGFNVLTARPAEREFGLTQAALADLFDGVLDDVLPRLPEPQRHALEVAFLLEPAGDEPADPRAVAVAIRAALRLLAETRPVLVAVDDVQWLDAGSTDALAFALRRLDGAGVRLLAARRGPAGPVEDALDPARVVQVGVGPLGLDAIRALATARTGHGLARPVVVRLQEASGGNPFVAIELCRALADGAPFDPVLPLAIPDAMHAVLQTRLSPLPESTRAALLVVAALGAPPVSLASAAGADAESLAPAVAADVVEMQAGQVRFTHPLLASHVYATAPERRRRELHRSLAALLDDPVARACHLEHSISEPDAAVASKLEEAAAIARRQGAPALAASLGEAAARTTPAGAPIERHRRLLASAQDHLQAGSTQRAGMLARDVLDDAADSRTKAEALIVLGEIEQQFGSLQLSIRHREEALALVPGDWAVRFGLHQRLAITTRFTEGIAAAEAHANAALALADEHGDDTLRSCALAALAVTRFNQDEPDGVEIAERALTLARAAESPPALKLAAAQLGHCLFFSGRLDRARSVLEQPHGSHNPDDQHERFFAWYLALVEARAGHAELARRHAARCREITLLYGGEDVDSHPSPLLPMVFAAAFAGDEYDARRLAESALRHPQESEELTSLGRSHLALLAMLDHWQGDAERAGEGFDVVERSTRAAGYGYATCFWLADHVEVLVKLGHSAEALELLDAWEPNARAVGNAPALADVIRCRGLAAASGKNTADAIRRLEDAVSLHRSASDPFGCARALLALGAAQRQARRRRDARETLAAATAEFERFGNHVWADRARAEERHVSGRTSTNGLTPAQTRVAELVAAGSTNREVAERLFVSERTVENHLSHIYAKVGVRSRTQLARRWRET